MLKNYLHLLEENIKLIGTKKILLRLHAKQKKSYKEIAIQLGIGESSYRQYIQELAHPPIWFITKLKILDSNIFSKLENTNLKFTARKQITTLPKNLSNDLAYFIGYLHGDGFLGSDKKTVGFSDEYKNQLIKINAICFKIFNKKGKIRKVKSPIGKKGSYHLEIRQNVINSFLHRVFKIPRGFKDHLEISSEIFKNKNFLKFYLMGIYDADGTLPKNPEKVKQNFIDVGVKSKKLMCQIKLALKKFEISTLKLYARKTKSIAGKKFKKPSTIWELRIRRKSEIIRFLKDIGFNHPIKKKRMKKLQKKLGL
jgi:hypothetical protein